MAVLARDPAATREDRDPRAIADTLVQSRIVAADAAQTAAEEARRIAGERRRQAGLLGRLRPSVRREIRATERAAEEAEKQADLARFTGSERLGIEEQARATARSNIARRDRWRATPEVKEAERRAEELRLVAQAIERRDPAITAAAASGNLRRARELAVEQMDERRKAELEQRMRGYGDGALPRRGKK